MYTNNTEYRHLLRCFFNMNIESLKKEIKNCHYDEETYDEMLFDDIAVNKGMTVILKKTKDNILFDELYSLAAAKMFSMDRETGLCILLSYDYFYIFHDIWVCYDETPLEFTHTNELFVLLKNKLLQK